MSERLLNAARKRGLVVPPPPHTAVVLGELAAALFVRPQRGARRMPREEAYLETARRVALPTSWGTLAAWEWGEPAAPLVGLVHGWEGHGAQLGAFAAPLVAAGFRVLTFDMPGHGESPGDEAHVPLLGRVLAELQRTCGPFFAFIGHSMGAAGAAMAAAQGAAVRGLVLLAPPLSQRERVERVAARLELAPEVGEVFFAAVARRTQADYADVDLRAVAKRAPCALLVWHDPADEDTRFAGTEEFVGLWRGARLVPCPGRGHYRILMTPEIVRQSVEFLSALR